MPPTHIAALHTELVRTIHFLHQKGYAPATSSNYSVRETGDDCFYVSESGIDKGDFTIANLIYVDANGKPINDPRRPSAETDLHTLIYQLCPAAHCVLHTHTLYNTVLSKYFAAAKSLVLQDYEVLKGLTGIATHTAQVVVPIFENTQHIPDLCQAVATYWHENPDLRAFLIVGHGLYTWGNTLADAKRHIEVLEFLLACEYELLALRKA
jgi:methylthioribulose-1-phosphate dehydratase